MSPGERVSPPWRLWLAAHARPITLGRFRRTVARFAALCSWPARTTRASRPRSRAALGAAIVGGGGVLGDGVGVDGLVLIPDMPGRMPKELRHLAQVVSGGLPHTWSLPWVDAWRFGPLDPAADLPKEFHALLADLHLNSTAP